MPSRNSSPAAISRKHRRGGWTLVELAIALGVLGLLVGIALPLYGVYIDRANVSSAASDIRLMSAEIDQYILEFQRVPDKIDKLIDPLPVDPWGNPYRYLKLGGAPPGQKANARKDKNLVPLNTDYDLYSVGKDGQTKAPLNPKESQDDVIRANDGGYVGLASHY